MGLGTSSMPGITQKNLLVITKFEQGEIRTGSSGVCTLPDELETVKPLSRMIRLIRPKRVLLGIMLPSGNYD